MSAHTFTAAQCLDIPSAEPAPQLRPNAPLHIVLNPGSGKLDTAERIDTVRSVLTAAGRPFELTVLRRAGDLIDAGKRAVAWAQAHGGAVVAAGGDGTINTLSTLVLPAGVPMGVLPQGTFNYVARAHGIPTELEEATRALLTARVRPVQVGLVNERVFLVNGSMGLYPEVLDDRETFKQRLGRSRPVAVLAGLFTLLRPHHDWVIRIDVDGRETTVVTSTLFVGNNVLQLEQVGIDEVPALRDGQLVAIMARPMSRAAMLGLMLRGAMGQLGQADQVTSLAFTSLTVSPRLPHKPRRLKVATDGETEWMRTPLRFEVSPRRLHLLVPG